MKKTIVLGASPKKERYSNIAIHKLRQYGHEVIAIGKRTGTIAGIEIHTTLHTYQDIDTITVYLNPTHQQLYYEYIISLRPQRVIFNPGTENPEFYAMLKAAAISYEEACTLVLLSTNQY